MSPRYLPALSATLLLACNSVSYVDTRTQLLLRVSVADDATQARASALRIAVATLDGETWVEVPALKLDAAHLQWPVEIPVFPRRDEAQNGRLVEMVVDLLGDDQSLAQTRVLARYVRGERRTVDATLFVCASEGGVCEAGECHGSACLVCDPAQQCVPTPTVTPRSDDARDGGSGAPTQLSDAAVQLNGGTSSLLDGSSADACTESCLDAESGAGRTDGGDAGDADGVTTPADDGGPAQDAQSAPDGMISLPEAGTLKCPSGTVCNGLIKAFVSAYVGTGMSTCTYPDAQFPEACSNAGAPCFVGGAQGTCQNGFCIVQCNE